MKTKGMISRIICIIFSALVYVSLAFTFIASTSKVLNKTITTEISFSDWWDMTSEATADCFNWWKIAQVLYIVLFVLAGLLIIGTIIQFFVKNKYLNLSVKIAGILTLIIAILSAVFNILGQLAVTNELNLGEYFSMIPHVGMVVMAIAGIVAGSLGIVCGKKLKKR